MIPVALDMETADPDDAMTLCFLLSHPGVNLQSVTLTPGSNEQVGLVRHIMHVCEYPQVPVGTRRGGHKKEGSCVSSFHRKWLGSFEDCEPDGEAPDILFETMEQDGFRKTNDEESIYTNVTLLTGAALTNPFQAMEAHPELILLHWVAQGGFAGDSVVPKEYRLEKFDGMETCATFNFNGNPKGAEWLLGTHRVQKRHCISKNVCHGMAYDREMHEQVAPHKDKNAALSLLYKGMDVYLKNKPRGKLFHDPLAAAAMINPDICEWREVEIYRHKGKWGSRLKEGTNTFISIKADRQKLIEELVR
jgi:pyrimidine-specific ribonucleoside hydrolase